MPFPLGKLLATPGALNHLALTNVLPMALVARHLQGDWGDLCADDQRRNETAISTGDRIVSAYVVGGLKVYVITEWDRSYTTMLLASEY